MKLIRPGNYANVTATLALVLALGGTSYAAIDLAKNSVSSATIKNNTIKSKDVKNGNLRAKDFKAGQLPAGAQGPAGPAGAVGPVGPSTGFSSHDTGFIAWSGTDGQTVRSLNLPAGSYVLSAKVVGNNNAPAATAFVECRLNLGGVLDDNALILAPNLEVDRGTFSLLGTATIAAAGIATLICDSPNTNGAWSGATITAVKVGSIG